MGTQPDRRARYGRRARAALRAALRGGRGLLLVGFLGCCSCSGPPPPDPAPVFYPPSPAAPRLQFLRRLASSTDVRGPRSAFARFVLGPSSAQGQRRLVRPYGMALWDGELTVCDSGARAAVALDFEEQAVRAFGQRGSLRLGLPVNVAVGPGGERFVTDTKRGQVAVFDRAGRPIRALRGGGEMKPCGVAWHDGVLFVSDLATDRIVVLNPRSGAVVRAFGGRGGAPGRFFQPTNLAVGPQGHLFVSDTLNARVQKLDQSGAVVGIIGSRGGARGQMVRPKGIAVDRDGRLYVADAATESVQLYDREGRLLMSLGEPGVGRGQLALPAGVAVSYQGLDLFAEDVAAGFRLEYLVFVSCHLGPNKINVYGFLRPHGARPRRSAPAVPPAATDAAPPEEEGTRP